MNLIVKMNTCDLHKFLTYGEVDRELCKSENELTLENGQCAIVLTNGCCSLLYKEDDDRIKIVNSDVYLVTGNLDSYYKKLISVSEGTFDYVRNAIAKINQEYIYNTTSRNHLITEYFSFDDLIEDNGENYRVHISNIFRLVLNILSTTNLLRKER